AVLQIAEGRGKAFPASEEVLVDPQDLRTASRMPFFELALQSFAKVALHGGGADLFPPPQAAAVDAVEMLLVDRLLIRFAGSLTGKNSRQALAKVAATAPAAPFGNLQLQPQGAGSPVLMADVAGVSSFIP